MSKNLLKRIVTSFFLLSILIIVNFSHHFIFILSLLIVGLIVCFEFNNILAKLINFNSADHKIINKRINFKFLLLNIIVYCYIFLIFCQYSYAIHKQEGPIFFIYLISICFFTDIGGYVFGKTIGGKKLTKISPNKTVSGSIGSFITSIFSLLLFVNLEYLELKFNINNIFFCLIISLISQLGDLFVSYLKRKANIKDTGKILPGHGGLLDRIDGIIFAVPFSYYLIMLI